MRLWGLWMRMRLSTTSYRLFAEMKFHWHHLQSVKKKLTVTRQIQLVKGEGKKTYKAMLRNSNEHVSLALGMTRLDCFTVSLLRDNQVLFFCCLCWLRWFALLFLFCLLVFLVSSVRCESMTSYPDCYNPGHAPRKTPPVSPLVNLLNGISC